MALRVPTGGQKAQCFLAINVLTGLFHDILDRRHQNWLHWLGFQQWKHYNR